MGTFHGYRRKAILGHLVLHRAEYTQSNDYRTNLIFTPLFHDKKWVLFVYSGVVVSICLYLQSPEDIVGDLVGGGLAAHVGAEVLALLKVTVNSSVDLGSSLLLVQELEHEGNTAEGGNGVGNVLALNVRGRTVARLTHGETITDIGRRNKTQRADQGSGTVGENVSVKVGGNNDIVGLWLTEELVDHRVDDLLFDTDARELVLSESCAGSGSEKTVCLRQHVGLVGDGDEGALVGGSAGALAHSLPPEGNLTSHVGNAEGGLLADALDGLGDLAVGSIVRLLLLDVEILGVLTDDDEVDRVGEHGGVLDRLDGADVGVEV